MTAQIIEIGRWLLIKNAVWSQFSPYIPDLILAQFASEMNISVVFDDKQAFFAWKKSEDDPFLPKLINYQFWKTADYELPHTECSAFLQISESDKFNALQMNWLLDSLQKFFVLVRT